MPMEKQKAFTPKCLMSKCPSVRSYSNLRQISQGYVVGKRNRGVCEAVNAYLSKFIRVGGDVAPQAKIAMYLFARQLDLTALVHSVHICMNFGNTGSLRPACQRNC